MTVIHNADMDDREVGVPAPVGHCTHPNTTQHPTLTHPRPHPIHRFELGRDVTKVFNGKLFRGHIGCIDSDDDDGGLLYTVVYEDGGNRSSRM